MHIAASYPPRSRPLTTVQRWLALIDHHGSENAALVALFKHVDELERLKQEMRDRGLAPEHFVSETHGSAP